MIDPELLNMLCCPETHQRLAPAPTALVESLNRQIEAGQLRTRANQPVREKLDGGLVRTDGHFLYAIRQNIPLMLIDEAVPLPH